MALCTGIKQQMSVDFCKNTYRMRKKSLYHRTYYILNVIDDIAQKNRIQIGYLNRKKILRAFILIDRAASQINANRKRMISINYILKHLFGTMRIKCKFIPLTRSKKTLQYYNQWLRKVYELIKDDIFGTFFLKFMRRGR